MILFDHVRHGLVTLLAMVLIASVLLNVINVVLRYGFDQSFLWSDEVQVYAMVALTFLGAIVVSSESGHLRVDIVRRSLGPHGRFLLDISEQLLLIVICAIVTWASFGFGLRLFSMGQGSSMANIPMWIPHGFVTVGFACMTAIACARLARISVSGHSE